MIDSPFALEWTLQTMAFGQLREVHGHDFYESEGEMREQAERLKDAPKVQQITYYQRKNGSLQVIEQWLIASS